MAAATMDLKTPATFPIRLGASILKAAEGKKFASVRYNHRPRLEDRGDVACSIRDATSKSTLNLQAGEDKYVYSGRRVGDGDQYVLLAKGKEMVLERLEACREFNLIQTPTEADASKVEKAYPQLLHDNDATNDDLFGDEDEGDRTDGEPIDPNNTFDYRNYLEAGGKRDSENIKAPQRSAAGTAQVQPKAASTTPTARPAKRQEAPLVAQKKRKALDTSKPNPKRVKAGTEPPAPASSSKPATRPDVPKLRMDRKASLQIPPADDPYELIVENETPVQEKPRSAMALALAGQLGSGPISLHSAAHSAANSPAGQLASNSPMPRRPDDMEEGEEFEIGGSSPEAPAAKTSQRAPDEDGDDEDQDADADVDDLELPSPVQAQRRAEAEPQQRDGDDDDKSAGVDEDDDLDEQLARAMAEEDDPPPAAPAHESDEESEEE